jgi:hypothetical protein
MEKTRTHVNRAFRGGVVGKSVHFLSKIGRKRLAEKGALWALKNIYFFGGFCHRFLGHGFHGLKHGVEVGFLLEKWLRKK